MKEKKIRRISYRTIISISIFAILMLFIVGFFGYSYFDLNKQNRQNTVKEAEFAANRLTEQIDERLSNLWQYYISAADDSNIEWIMKNYVDISDYIHIHSAQEILANKKLFGDYINSYTFIVFSSGIVITDKGVYTFKEMTNSDAIFSIFSHHNDEIDKNYWYYGDTPLNVSENDRDYRTTVDTMGLNIVVKLPMYSPRVNGLILVNIDMDMFKNWIMTGINNNEEVVVTDADGNVVFATNDDVSKALADARANGGSALEEGLKSLDSSATYMAGCSESDILGWKYYVFENVKTSAFTFNRFTFLFMVFFLITIIAALSIFAWIVYEPIRSLVKNVSESGNSVKGNEFDYLSNRFEVFKHDRQLLQNAMTENRRKLQELFELRLIRGEVRSEDEWIEYSQGLHLEPCKCFATCVMVLNLKGEFDTEDNISEDSVCLRLVEELPDELDSLTWMPLVYNACTMFCMFGADNENALLERIMRFHEGMQNYAKTRFGFKILMGVSATHTERRHIYAAYRESVNALTMVREGDKDEPECHFYLAKMTEKVEPVKMNFDVSIQEAVKAVDKDLCYTIIDDFHNFLRELNSQSDMIYYIDRMMNSILETAVLTGLDLAKVYPDGLRKLFQDAFEVVEPTRIRRYLKYALIDPVLLARSRHLENSSVSFIERIEEKILEKGGRITLNECAESLDVQPTYIWKLLKMEKNMSFNEFAENYKINVAKEMLLKSDEPIDNIAVRLGYTNAQNFSRIFTQETGVSPGKFRKLY